MSVLRRNLRRERFNDRRPKWWQIPEHPDEEADYDRDAMMLKIDVMEPEWRALVNERGFTAVIKTMFDTTDINVARRLLRQRHDMRQMQLARGQF